MEEVEEVVVEKVIEEDEVEDFKTNDDGTLEEVYRDKRTGNIVMNPKIRNANKDKGRRDKCWDYYIQTVRDGNPSAKAAAIYAGFSENTAINIRKMRWFKERNDRLRDSKMMSNSERNLQRIINLGLTKLKKLEDGGTEEVFDIERAKLVADISKFVLTTIGRDKYSTKTEVKVSALPVPIMEIGAIDVTPLPEENNDPTIE